ncbi:hypothetical protein CIRG_08849 [Coccidioides immitis RMSCC 2394]|uniref:Uncharacterized protein n=1 Tax=Coccidioides immitis RMSCC 2394 TaxID=404692 RepID=A0A0J6YQC4_COCIT|nr:hypothetical protein CIRG_08849 [Coccidioides immitis RMSCC 2394]
MDLLGVYEYAALLMIMMKGSIIIGAQARAKVLEGEKGSFAEVSGRNRRLPYLCVDQVRAVTSLCFFPSIFHISHHSPKAFRFGVREDAIVESIKMSVIPGLNSSPEHVKNGKG